MSERRTEPTPDPPPARGQHLWAAVRPHAVDPGTLGEYVARRLRLGPDEAAGAFPAVAAHLAEGCAICARAGHEIEMFLRRELS